MTAAKGLASQWTTLCHSKSPSTTRNTEMESAFWQTSKACVTLSCTFIFPLFSSKQPELVVRVVIDPRFHLNFRSWRIETQCVKRTLLIANFYIVGKVWAKIGRTRIRKSSPDWITPCVSGLAWLRSTTTIYRGNSGAASHPQTWTHFAISYVIQFGRQVQ